MRSSKTLFLATAVGLTLASSALATPYASFIRLSDADKSIAASTEFPVNITYRLNEAADSVTIRIKDNTNATVATFAGTATIGANSVAWNGTADNAAGTPLGTATGYKIEIQADKTVAVGFTQIKRNASGTGTVFAGFSPRDVVVPMDPSSDLFGLVFAASAYNTGANKAAAIIPFYTDLEPISGNGFASRVMKHPLDPAGTAPGTMNSGTIWGIDLVPGTNRLFGVGQNLNSLAVPSYFTAPNTGGVPSSDLVSADPDAALTGFANPRDSDVVLEGAQLWAYTAQGNSDIRKTRFDGTKLVAPTFNILGLVATNMYSKLVEFDSAGNLYWISKGTGGAARVFRWDAAQVQAIDDNADPKLTEANATWTISPGAGFDANNWMDLAITPNGNVYLATGTADNVYLVGNTSSATLTKAMVPADLAYDPTNALGATYNVLTQDYAGNLIVFDGGPEALESAGPGGTSNLTIPAPTSQTFAITGSSVSDWTALND